ncbi:MAG: hypothetical protein Q9157_003868 [Trypethelium eluteriae]
MVVPEPLILTTSSIALAEFLVSVVDGCRRLYKGWKLTQSFGEDYQNEARKLQIQWARIEVLGQRNTTYLRHKAEILPDDAPYLQSVRNQLENLQNYFEECDRIVKRYKPKEDDPSILEEIPKSVRAGSAGNPTELQIPVESRDQDGDTNPEKDHLVSSDDGNAQPPRITIVRAEPGGTEGIASKEIGEEAPHDLQEHGHTIVKAEEKSKGKMRQSLSKLRVWKRQKDEQGHGHTSATSSSSKSSGSTEILSGSSETTRSHRSKSASSPVSGSVMLSSDHFASIQPSFGKKKEPMDRITQESNTSSPDTAPRSVVPFSREAPDNEHRSARKEAEKTQKNIGFWHRSLYWVAEDRSKFKDLLEEIRKGVNILESLLLYKVPDDAEHILEIENESAVLKEHATVSGAIVRLHKSLVSRNIKKEPLITAVKLAVYSKRDRRLVDNQESHLAFREDSYLFILQTRKLEGSDSIRIGAETTISASTEANLAGDFQMDELRSLDEILQVPINDELEGDWTKLAAVWQNGTPSDVQRLFYEHGTRFNTKRTLENLLDTSDFKDVSATPRTQLAVLLAIAHLYFTEVLDGLPDPIVRPSHFEFYLRAEADGQWNNLDSFLCTPYLSIGFGLRPPKVDIGAESGVVDSVHNPLVELGLLLYQVASGDRIDYGHGIGGLRSARDKALHRLHAVDRELGVPFAELVESCLSIKEREARGSKSKDEVSLLKGAYGRLEQIWNELKETD